MKLNVGSLRAVVSDRLSLSRASVYMHVRMYVENVYVVYGMSPFIYPI